MAPSDADKRRNIETLSSTFSNIDVDTLEMILEHHGHDYRKTYQALVAMSSGAVAEPSVQPTGDRLLLRFVTCQTRNIHEDCVQLSQITFFANHVPLSVKSVSNPGGNNPYNEGPRNIMDGSTRTKWLDFCKRPLVMELENTSVIPDSYVLVTANDCPNRDPARWRIEQRTDNGRSWQVLDYRSGDVQDITQSRLAATCIYQVGGGAMSGSAGGSSVAGKSYPMSDRDLIAYWANPDTARPAEFSDTIASICIVPELMGTSCMDHKIAKLEEIMNQNPLRETFETTAARFVGRAFAIGNIQHARRFNGSDPGDSTLYGNFYRSLVVVYNDLDEWQKPLLHMALVEMLLHHDKDGMQVLCGLFLRASRECMARKYDVFMIAIQRSTPNDSALRQQDAAAGSVLDSHKARLFHEAQIAVDDLKDKAFKSVFVEPTKLYFHAVGDTIMEGDVEVHGSNTYLALLLSALGVKLARSPLLDDEVKGVAPYIDSIDQNDLQKLWETENLGKHWETVLVRRTYVFW